MKEKTHHLPSILLTVIALLITLKGLIVEGAIVAIVAIIISIIKRKKYKISICISFSIIVMLCGAGILWACLNYGITEGYWLLELLK